MKRIFTLPLWFLVVFVLLAAPLVASLSLVQLVLILVVVGVLLWLVNNFIPMQGSIKRILNAVVVIAVVLWLLNVFGLFSSISGLRVGG